MQRRLTIDDADVDLSVDFVSRGGGHSDIALLVATAGLLNLQHQGAQSEVALDGGEVAHWVDFDVADALQRRKSVESCFSLFGVRVRLLLLGGIGLLLGAAFALVLLVVDSVGRYRAFLLWLLCWLGSFDDWLFLVGTSLDFSRSGSWLSGRFLVFLRVVAPTKRKKILKFDRGKQCRLLLFVRFLMSRCALCFDAFHVQLNIDRIVALLEDGVDTLEDAVDKLVVLRHEHVGHRGRSVIKRSCQRNE